MFRFRISALPWLPKIWRSTSALLFCTDCQKCEVPLPHFRSVLTGKDLKFRFPHLFCQDFQRCGVPLPHFISAWTSKDFQFRFCTFVQSWLPKIWRSASPLTLCLHCQIWVVPPPHFPPQFCCKFILCISTQFRAVLHEGLALQRDEASLFASKKSKPSNSHLVKFKRFLHVSECNLASTWKICWTVYTATLMFRANDCR